MEGLGAALGPSLRLSTTVRAIHPRQGGWRLSLLDAGGLGELDAGALVVALPAPDAADLLEPLDAELAGELRALRAAPIAAVHLGVRREEVWRV